MNNCSYGIKSGLKD